jgi:hypothetical protein
MTNEARDAPKASPSFFVSFPSLSPQKVIWLFGYLVIFLFLKVGSEGF